MARIASKLAEFLTNPSPRHHSTANQYLQYLDGTRSYALQFNGSLDSLEENLLITTNATFADNSADRKSS